MSHYVITRQCNPAEKQVPTFRQGFLFNEWQHLRQQSSRPLHLLTVFNTESQEAEARCAFFEADRVAKSPASAPFGSIEFTDAIPDSTLQTFIRSLTNQVRRVGYTKLRIVNYPHCYAPRQALRLTQMLQEQGFRLTQSDITFFIAVTDYCLESLMHPQERRRLRKGCLAGLTFEHWKTPDIHQVVDFWLASRQQQGYALTLPPDQLAYLLTKFPDRFPVFTVRSEQSIAALSVGVWVRNDILYNFLPVDNLLFRHLSPMVFLLNGLYRFCQQQAIQILDLGVSLDADRKPKASLERFKQNMGAITSPKLVFEKCL